MIRKNNYQQIKQTGLEGKNLEETEIRHPLPPDFNADKDARLVSENTNKREYWQA